MAYLPFYITPEECVAYQEAQEQEVTSGEDTITWQKFDIEEPNRYSNILFSLIPIVVMAGVLLSFWFTADKDEIIGFSFIVFLILGYGYCYLVFGLDYRYEHTFSEKGFVVKKRRNMPKWVNTAAQVMGWFGAIVCVFMVAVAGPMALAGAGGFILLSFGMLKRKPDEPTEIKVGMREDWLFAYYNKKRKVIQFFYKHDNCYYRDIYKTTIFRSHSRGDSYIFFKTVTDLEAMIEKLSNDYHLECIEVEDHKEIFKGKPEPKLADIPVRNLEYPIDDTFELRAKKTPPPKWKYIYRSKWRTKAEIEELNADTAKE
ncbi:hypothetical protein [Vibrio japonicus]|uniref:Uncharacterized protein n=1 Tax=Vibrio japonicus TaxID=1824638 RepID=A0ABY5LPH8_9VIBR|nr:hypothetical protein [Vibrio japonicus]UUM32850.1 hypothetical protein NP165_14920 [Vibrio japonicus]